MIETRRTICRFCHAGCPVLVDVDVELGRPLRVRGDRDDPLYRGFTCEKGRQLAEQHNHPERLLHSLRKRADGSHEPVAVGEALDDIAARLRAILDRHGPRAVAIYSGTCASRNPAARPVLTAFMDAIGSPMRFDSNTIDQPGKAVAAALHGVWGAPPHGFDGAKVALLIGGNPLMAMSGGVPNADPIRRMREARRRGLQLLVIDPRRTETAAAADLHLQPVPGEDIAILASLLHVILSEGLHDNEFTELHVRGLDELRRAVQPFAPGMIAGRAGLRAEEIVECARRFALAGRGVATSGTGPSFTGRGSTLAEYLVMCLNTLCGRYLRAGEQVWNPGVITPTVPHIAQATPPWQAYGYGEQMRVRGLGDAACGLPTAALADEILLEGPGQVRALIVLGGNPVAAWPDRQKTWEAMQALDLLVTFDIKRSATAKAAHYVLAPPLPLEIMATTYVSEVMYHYAVGFGLPVPYAHAAPAVTKPPPGSELIEEWRAVAGIARRMGVTIELYPNFRHADDRPLSLDGDESTGGLPTLEEVVAHLYQHGRVPLAEIIARGRGTVFDRDAVIVQQAEAGWAGRLDVESTGMLAELEEVARTQQTADDRFPFRLVCRRHSGVLNSSGLDLPKTRRRPYNPAYMHPDDLVSLGLRPGDSVEIRSERGAVPAIVQPDATLRLGLISMSHAYGDGPASDARYREIGSNLAVLTHTDADCDRITGMPRLSNIAVTVTPQR